MKDYSELIKDECITNYHINNNEIIIYYGNKKYEIKNYTEELEKEILTKMENQAKKAIQLKTNLENEVNSDINICSIMFLLTIIHIIMFITNSISMITYISSPIVSLLFCVSLKDVIKGKNKIKELKKIEYFFQNQLNNINKFNNIKLSKKATKHLESKNLNFDINNIDNFSLSDLKKIKEFIDKEYKQTEETNQKVKTLN